MAHGMLKPAVFVASVVNGLSHHIRRLLPMRTVTDIDLTDEGLVSSKGLQQIPNAEILVADPRIVCQIMYDNIPLMKWIHCTWAGVEMILNRIDPSKPLPTYHVTRTGEGYGQLMAEFVLCHTIAFERDLRAMYHRNDARVWKQNRDFRPLSALVIGIMGVGQIGREVARACKMMGMEVLALSRNSVLSVPCTDVDKVLSIKNLKAFLSKCDYVCNILPSTPQTRQMLSGNVLEACKNKGAVFINIGRADIIDDASLIKALREQWLRGAILDVFNVEPLPVTSELWTVPNVTISPHSAGPSFHYEVAECFVKNYQHYENGTGMKFVVDWTKGY